MPSAFYTTIIVATSKSTTSSSSSSIGTVVFLVVIGLLLFVMYRRVQRPRQQQAQNMRSVLDNLEPGDEVLTGAGIFGTIQQVQGDRVTLWTGTGSTITVLKRTISRKVDDDFEDEQHAGAGGSAANDTHDADDSHDAHDIHDESLGTPPGHIAELTQPAGDGEQNDDDHAAGSVGSNGSSPAEGSVGEPTTDTRGAGSVGERKSKEGPPEDDW